MAGYHWTSTCFYHRYMMLAKRKTPEDLSLFLSKCLIFTFTRLKKWIVLTTHFHEQLYFWKQTRRQFKLITLRFSGFFSPIFSSWRGRLKKEALSSKIGCQIQTSFLHAPLLQTSAATEHTPMILSIFQTFLKDIFYSFLNIQ